jgi:class 3 adenylate cyclase/TolB-like protein
MSDDSSRHLAAVWFADIVGYTSLSERNEDAALKLVGEFQTLANRIVAAHWGRVVKFVGDAVLTVFESAGKAVDGALALLDEFSSSELAKELNVTLRIGVHVGEIHTAEDGDVYGDGVNTASRIEGAAGPGQVFLSGFALESIRHRANLRTEPVGKRRLKGLSRSMELFVVGPADGGDPREIRFTPPVQPEEKKGFRLGQVVAVGLLAGMAGLIGVGMFAGASPFNFNKAPMNENAEEALRLGKESYFRGDFTQALDDLERSLELTGSKLQKRQGLRYIARTHNMVQDSAATLSALDDLLTTEPPLAILIPGLEDENLMELYFEARRQKIRSRGVHELSEPLRKIMVFDFQTFSSGVEMVSEGMTEELGYLVALMMQTELDMKGLPVASVSEMSFQEGEYDAYLDLDSALVEMRDEGPSHLILGSVAIQPRGALISAWLYEMETGALVLSEQVTGSQEDLVMKLPEELASRLAEALEGVPSEPTLPDPS